MSKFYSKEKIIGSGTYGNVWLVKSKVNRSFYVLKEVNLATLNSTERQQALNEVTILSRCKHANIIRYKDAVIDHSKGMLSILMEYADGGDLYSSIFQQKGVPFEERTVITWFLQMCLALQYIHHKSILHRDLKTRNIFLTRNKVIKIGDFGISRSLRETNQLATTAIGTPYYLSPEICQRKPYNHKSDIWALGCILFEMAALSHPFQASSFHHLLSLILTGQRKELPRHCSSIIQNLVQLLLDGNPESRPSTDEILELPYLQPYLSEIWISQGSQDLPQLLSQKMNVKSLSLCEELKISTDTTKRRLSIASMDSRSIKGSLPTASKSKDISSLRSRCHSIKRPKKVLPISAITKDHHCSTYKVFCPLKKLSNKTSSATLKQNVKSSKSPMKRTTVANQRRRTEESDCGYQSEDAFKTISSNTQNVTSSPHKTSIRKGSDFPKFFDEQESLEQDDVFGNVTIETNLSFGMKYEKASLHSCLHSQCQQCMLDMLWQNRIRGIVGPLKYNVRSEFIQKLQSVFSGDLFDIVYKALISQWELNDSECLPETLRELTKSLTYSQLQHLPLIMQLVQLDIIKR